MKGVLNDTWENMHHAYLIVGGASSQIWQELEGLNFEQKANPDALSLELETFGVDESRDLSAWALTKPFGERKVAVISTISITGEAQNALLKIFEEPVPNTYFFLLVNNSGSIIPTLISRMHVLHGEGKEELEKGKKFLEGSIGKRLKLVASIVKNKDKEEARSLIGEMAKILRSNGNNKNIDELLQAERYLSGRSPSIKMILEYLATTL